MLASQLLQSARGLLIEDTLDSKDSHSGFLLSTRSGYLLLYRDGRFVGEPYYPCHFSKQFGFCQGIPSIMKNTRRSFTLEEGGLLWNSFTQLNTGLRLYVPSVPVDPANLATEQYRQWWGQRNNNYLTRGIEGLILGCRFAECKDSPALDVP